MDQDRVKAELAAKRKEGALLRRLGGLRQMASRIVGGGVPDSVRALIEQGFATPAYSHPHLVAQRRREIGEDLKGFSESDWKRTVAVLLPGFARSVEATLVALARRPYQNGPTCKPFRCPR